MEIFDENYNLLPEREIDLSAGEIVNTYKVKKDAVPIDNVTKFVWDKEDYMPIKMYIKKENDKNIPT